MCALMAKQCRPDMSLQLSCTTVIILPPGQEEPDATVMASIQAADDGRVFAEIKSIIASAENRASAWRKGMAEAVAEGGDWIFLLDAGETLHPAAFHMLAPALASYDVVWGGMELMSGEGRADAPRITKFAARMSPEFYHMTLDWWVGGSHLIRADIARRITVDASVAPAWFASYLSRLWRGARCLKTAQPLTRASQLPEVSAEDKAYLVDDLTRYPCFIDINYAGEQLKLPYTGRNPALEREQLRGLFYEQADLWNLRKIVPEGSIIADVGANTGNHTLFFSKVLKAGTVIPLEPNPTTIGFLKHMIAENRLENVDDTCLGIAVGSESGRADITMGRRGHLGTARMHASGDGSVTVKSLDELITRKTDLLKIDVEDMEVEVLKGAESLIRRDHPILMIEIQDENLLPILDMTDRLGYTVRDIFADFGYANYLLMPGAAEDLI